jgi:hypothetical protein
LFEPEGGFGIGTPDVLFLNQLLAFSFRISIFHLRVYLGDDSFQRLELHSQRLYNSALSAERFIPSPARALHLTKQCREACAAEAAAREVTMPKRYNVLFLCTGNSARSIMNEAIMKYNRRPNFAAYSAGSHPSSALRPEAVAELERLHLPTEGLRSKSWDEFTTPGSPHFDFIITVCDNAAGEIVPSGPVSP